MHINDSFKEFVNKHFLLDTVTIGRTKIILFFMMPDNYTPESKLFEYYHFCLQHDSTNPDLRKNVKTRAIKLFLFYNMT